MVANDHAQRIMSKTTTQPKASARQRRRALKTKSPLVGKFFHSLNEQGKIQWQGCILAEPRTGWYLVQLFEWAMGEPSNQQLIAFKQMHDWLFYDCAEDMAHSYEYGVARHLRTYPRNDVLRQSRQHAAFWRSKPPST
jgi:hypothetical protein